MFNSNRYLTRGVQTSIPFELQFFMWSLIDQLSEPKDYFQVFKLTVQDGKQHISHESEQPEYHKEYDIDTANPVTSKVYVIDDGTHCTMLLAEEY
ncbi:MAG: DUF960 domain-containing protein [Oscillospiraceae bacterium]|nr:DUF960 domain-containing protein [Oscillospiraceae bacterium]